MATSGIINMEKIMSDNIPKRIKDEMNRFINDVKIDSTKPEDTSKVDVDGIVIFVPNKEMFDNELRN